MTRSSSTIPPAAREAAGTSGEAGRRRPAHRSATSAVTRAILAEVARLNPDDPRTADDLRLLLDVGGALVHRATLDDEVTRRRRAAGAYGGSRAQLNLSSSAACAPEGGLAALVSAEPDGRQTREAIHAVRRIELPEIPARDHIALPEPRATVEGAGAAAVGEYLRGRDEHRTVVEVRVLTGGFSKETLLVRLADGAELVIRKVAPGRATDTLPGEFEALRFAAAGGVRVARPLWLDQDVTVLGGPLFATERMPGSAVGTVHGPAAGATAGTARELAAMLGRLHSLAIDELAGTPRPDMRSRQDLLAAIDAREAVVDAAVDAVPDSPGVALHHSLLAWLRAHLPAQAGRPVLVHGDVGFHNLLVENGSVTALLDWEMAHRGRAAEDLAYVRPSVERLIAWPEFLEIYTGAGGQPVDDAELRFFGVWQDVWRAGSCLRLRTKFVLDPVRLADGVSGLLLGTRFLHNALTTAFGC